jgi:hypothetical protein
VERECGASMVRVIIPALSASRVVSVPQSGSVARGASSGAKVRRCEGMDERDISEHLAGTGA